MGAEAWQVGTGGRVTSPGPGQPGSLPGRGGLQEAPSTPGAGNPSCLTGPPRRGGGPPFDPSRTGPHCGSSRVHRGKGPPQQRPGAGSAHLHAGTTEARAATAARRRRADLSRSSVFLLFLSLSRSEPEQGREQRRAAPIQPRGARGRSHGRGPRGGRQDSIEGWPRARRGWGCGDSCPCLWGPLPGRGPPWAPRRPCPLPGLVAIPASRLGWQGLSGSKLPLESRVKGQAHAEDRGQSWVQGSVTVRGHPGSLSAPGSN